MISHLVDAAFFALLLALLAADVVSAKFVVMTVLIGAVFFSLCKVLSAAAEALRDVLPINKPYR